METLSEIKACYKIGNFFAYKKAANPYGKDGLFFSIIN